MNKELSVAVGSILAIIAVVTQLFGILLGRPWLVILSMALAFGGLVAAYVGSRIGK